MIVFGKIYALVHLRSDRWYKLTRTILYGRLEDEKPFSSVRRLVEYEDHLLRLLRDAGLPTPRPLGFVEITPERKYLILMEYFEDAVEIGRRRSRRSRHPEWAVRRSQALGRSGSRTATSSPRTCWCATARCS